MKTINARGKACPEPVTMTKAVVDQGEIELEVLLDNPISASNVMRFLESRGYGVLLKDDEGMLTIAARIKQDDAASPAKGKTPGKEVHLPGSVPAPAVLPEAAGPETFSVLITARTLGRGDEQLGEILIKSFLGTLSQTDNAPVAVALMNEGVRLALFDSSSCDYLKNLEKKGVVVLVCGTCVNHFELGDRIGVGTISNMFEIVEALNKAHKIMTL